MLQNFDALLIVSFGGPEGPDDVVPFLRNVTKGRNIPDERLAVVGEHYATFDGVSPLNGQVRDFIAALRPALESAGHDLPVYWGNRNWHPMLDDTVRTIRDDGHKRVLAFVTSAYSSNSGCRQYQANIEQALIDTAPVGVPDDLAVVKIRPFFNHPSFVDTMSQNVEAALQSLPSEQQSRSRIAFTAHSIPLGMAEGCDYQDQLNEVAALVAERLSKTLPWDLVFQSRSGPPSVPWLEPDICDHIDGLAAAGTLTTNGPKHDPIIVAPIGFLSDHMEVIWDLDTEAKARAEHHEMPFVRAATVGTNPQFIEGVVALIEEYITGGPSHAVGTLGPRPLNCAVGCCPYTPQRPPSGQRPT